MKRFSLARIWTPGFYDRIAKVYDSFSWMVSPIGTDSQRRVLDGLPVGSLLDVGCGTGTLLAMADGLGHCCYGIDLSAGMLARARAKLPAARLIRSSFYQLPYPSDYFDTVVETNALGGVEIDVPQVLGEMLRVCKPGGQIRIADYAVPEYESWVTQFLFRIGLLIGDMPWDYVSIFQDLGLLASRQVLGGHGMYQLVIVSK